jgi:hypothetical protein
LFSSKLCRDVGEFFCWIGIHRLTCSFVYSCPSTFLFLNEGC